MGDRTNLLYMCQKNQNMACENSTYSKSKQKQSEPDRRMTPDLFDDYFEQVQASAVCKIALFCWGIDALKVINERCIAMSRNLAKVRSPITLNKSLNTQIQVLQQNLERNIIFSANISNMTSLFDACNRTRKPQHTCHYACEK